MKKIITITLLSVLALALTACGAFAGSPQSNSPSGSSSVGGSSNSSNPGPVNGTPATGLSGLQLAAGILKLDGTSNAVTAQEAAQLLPLWQSLQQMMSTPVAQSTPQDAGTPGPRFNPAMMQQVSSQITLIQNAMTPAQIQAITAMNLSRQDIFTVFQSAGITMGGPGQGGGGFGPNGGTFTPPQGTPQAGGNPGGNQGNGGNQGGYQGNGGNFTGGRRGFGGFIPPSVVNGIVTYLQKKAGS